MTECHCVCGPWTVPMESGGGGMLQVHVVLLAGAGAAVMIADRDARQNLKSVALGLLSEPGRLENMGRTSAQLGKPDAGRAIAATIMEMIQ